jgi:hypothetical protein
MTCKSGGFWLNRPNKPNLNIKLQKMTIDEGILSVEFVVFSTSLPIETSETLSSYKGLIYLLAILSLFRIYVCFRNFVAINELHHCRSISEFATIHASAPVAAHIISVVFSFT